MNKEILFIYPFAGLCSIGINWRFWLEYTCCRKGYANY